MHRFTLYLALVLGGVVGTSGGIAASTSVGNGVVAGGWSSGGIVEGSESSGVTAVREVGNGAAPAALAFVDGTQTGNGVSSGSDIGHGVTQSNGMDRGGAAARHA